MHYISLFISRLGQYSILSLQILAHFLLLFFFYKETKLRYVFCNFVVFSVFITCIRLSLPFCIMRHHRQLSVWFSFSVKTICCLLAILRRTDVICFLGWLTGRFNYLERESRSILDPQSSLVM